MKYKVTSLPGLPFHQTLTGNAIIYHYAHSYDIEAEATSLTDSSRKTAHEKIRILETPLVQYFAFYGQEGNSADMELIPGQNMNIWGRIHSNGDIYIGSPNRTIQLRNYDNDGNISPHSMTASGNIYAHRKHGEKRDLANTVEVKTVGTGLTFDPYEAITGDITSSNETSEESRFDNYVMVNEKSYAAPSKNSLKRSGFYEQRAMNPGRAAVDGMTIIGTGGDMEIHVSRPSYTNVTALVLASPPPDCNADLAICMIRESPNAFQDCREGGRNVNTTDIDLYALGLWYEAYLQDQGLALAGDGMLIYASRSPDDTFTNNGTDMEAIRLVTIDATSSPQLVNETTLATDNPIYIHGDFNTISTHGVALIGDAVNILSNAFTGKSCEISYSDLLSDYHAHTTTVNAALFAGHVPTNGAVYGGGVESYTRLHENWGQVELNISGAFINLWDSEQANGAWCIKSDCYSPPLRNWGWDVRFQDPDFWPPFIPSIFGVERLDFLE